MTGKRHAALTHAHAVNEEPWQPMRGQVKKRCPNCQFLFATANRGQEICHDCLDLARKGLVYGEGRTSKVQS